MRIAVIGGGWAGLSAAVHLDRKGHDVTVFEAARTAGGRARRVHSARLAADIDNGQHILLGAYHDTLALLETLGIVREHVLHEEPLRLCSANGQFALRLPSLPSPLHLIAGVLGARGLSWAEKGQLIAFAARLRREGWHVDPRLSVSDWLNGHGQSEAVQRQFWHPLCLAALNTAPEQASATLMASVLRDSLQGSASHSRVLIPRVDLSRLWPERLPRGVTMRPGHAVRELGVQTGCTFVDGQRFDAAILATGASSAARLIRGLPSSTLLAQQLDGFEYRPIATLWLRLERPWRVPGAMLMLNEDRARLHFGQWLFHRNAFLADRYSPPMLAVVVSDARELARHPSEAVFAAIVEQVSEQTRRFGPMPAVAGYELIVEKRATFAALPGLSRPDNATRWPRVFLAGDYTDTGYPGVLEGAVRSGLRAAKLAVNPKEG